MSNISLLTQRPKYRAYEHRDIDKIPQLDRLSAEDKLALRTVAHVLPFRVSNYVVEELINWDDAPEDAMYQLTFPQKDMLPAADFERVRALVVAGAPKAAIEAEARAIQRTLNPHPAGQKELNVPIWKGRALSGVQHKYRDTVLFFPSQGQTCHSYCTYCFRWAQFVGLEDLTFATREVESLVGYLGSDRDITDVLFTGGDPMVMRTTLLRRYIEPLLSPELDNVRTIRIGSKALAFWPHRFLTDSDADDLLRLFEQVSESGRHLTFMAHFSHPREIEAPAAQRALRRILDTGAVVRCQAPLIRHVNDDPAVWSRMWRTQVALGAIPYYMFVERDTGAKNYFEVPLARAHEIFQDAFRSISGLGRTVRGPSMSATPGKVVIDGVTTIHGEKVFALRFLQARDPAWVGRPFFAAFDPQATWFDALRPAFGEKEFFFEAELRRLVQEKAARSTLGMLRPEAVDEVSAA